MSKRLEIFKTGKHTAVSGVTIEFGESAVKEIADSYDPSIFQAPLVVGHPKLDDPAYGWVKSLAFNEKGILEAEPEQVNPDFAELVKQGAFKKISASIYLPDAPANPKPGTHYLRHVGFLGAAAPAVKGLKTASFAAAEDGSVTVEFGELNTWEVGSLARALRGLREWVLGKWNKEEADKALPSYLVEDVERAAARPDLDSEAVVATPGFGEPAKNDPPASTEKPVEAPPVNPDPAFGEVVPPKENAMTTTAIDPKAQADFAEKQAALEAKDAELRDREARITAAETKQRKADFASFCEAQVNEGRLIPALVPGMVEFMECLHQAPSTLEFGEGDEKQTPTSLDYFKSFVTGLPKVVSFGDVSGGTKPPADGPAPVEFAAAPGFEVDPEGLEELALAKDYAEKHGCSLIQAVARLKENGGK